MTITNSIEKERKFVVTDLDLFKLLESDWLAPITFRPMLVEQTYLNPLFFGGAFDEIRVRKTTNQAGVNFWRTFKNDTPQIDERQELDFPIDQWEYEKYLQLRDRTLKVIFKRRLRLSMSAGIGTLDFFDPTGPAEGLILFEIEGPNCPSFEPDVLPFKVAEVTGDKRYSNRAIASGSLEVTGKPSLAEKFGVSPVERALIKRVSELKPSGQ